jgi:hypothetical protein
MTTIILIAQVLFLIAYDFIEGKREGLYYYYKMKTEEYNMNRNEHALFSLQRVIFGSISLGLFILVIKDLNTWDGLLIALGIGCIFPFTHDDEYYIERHTLDNTVYGDGFNSQSTTSVAYSDKKKLTTPTIRNIAFAIGIIIMTYIIIKYK